MERSYFQAYYELERKHWWFVARGKLLMLHLNGIFSNKKIKILNVGAATGRTSELLSGLGEVVSVEYDTECFEFTKSVTNLDIIQGSILELPFEKEQFDLVCAFDVIEHVEDDRLAMQELLRVCKKGGYVSVTVPAFQWLWSSHDDMNHHFRRYTRPQLLQLHLEKEPLYSTYFNFWLFLPVALYRLASKIFGKKEQQQKDFEVAKEGLISRVLYKIFYSERFFLRSRFTLPFGISILSTWKKEQS